MRLGSFEFKLGPQYIIPGAAISLGSKFEIPALIEGKGKKEHFHIFHGPEQKLKCNM